MSGEVSCLLLRSGKTSQNPGLGSFHSFELRSEMKDWVWLDSVTHNAVGVWRTATGSLRGSIPLGEG